jgi:hypothetical protein
MKQILLETSSAYVIVILLVAIALAYVMYAKQSSWNTTVNKLLFALRAVLLFVIMFLLLGPIVKHVTRYFEKPILVVVHDRSESIALVLDSLQRNILEQQVGSLEQSLTTGGYEVVNQTLEGNSVVKSQYAEATTDIHQALIHVSSQYEGRNVSGVVLISDGIYNQGISPIHRKFNFPIHSVGIGDTTIKQDLLIKHVSFNKIAYQGNKFPIRVELQAKGFESHRGTVKLLYKSKVILEQTITLEGDQLSSVDFYPLAEEKGIQKYDVEFVHHPSEYNRKNNYATAFIDVVEGKKNILMIASAPHPDIKAIREVITKNANYEFSLYIPGVTKGQAPTVDSHIDLAIFHQAPDLRGTTRLLFQQYLSSPIPTWVIIGGQTDLRQLVQLNAPIKIESFPRDYDQVIPSFNPNFTYFSVSPDVVSAMGKYPYVSVHFGKISAPEHASIVLYQQIGNIISTKPLLYTTEHQGKRVGVMLGEGLWRWPLSEYDRTEGTKHFKEFFSKWIQYLSSTDRIQYNKHFGSLSQSYLKVRCIIQFLNPFMVMKLRLKFLKLIHRKCSISMY